MGSFTLVSVSFSLCSDNSQAQTASFTRLPAEPAVGAIPAHLVAVTEMGGAGCAGWRRVQVAVTYMWLGEALLELMGILEREFGLDAQVWLDIIFNDQRTAEAVGQVSSSGSARW